jgi:hypothetical protein
MILIYVRLMLSDGRVMLLSDRVDASVAAALRGATTVRGVSITADDIPQANTMWQNTPMVIYESWK